MDGSHLVPQAMDMARLPPWQTIALGNLADAGIDPTTELAWSTDKAGAKEVDWMSFIAGPSLAILKGWLDNCQRRELHPLCTHDEQVRHC